MKRYIKKVTFPAWSILILGIIFDFILALKDKYKLIQVNIMGVEFGIPAFTLGAGIIFILMNAKKWWDMYQESRGNNVKPS